MLYANRLQCVETLIREISDRLPGCWALDGDTLVDGFGNPLVEVARCLNDVDGYPDSDAFHAKAGAALQAMAYGPDAMLTALRLVSALYQGDADRVARLVEDLLELLARGLAVERERLEEAVMPATYLVAERSRRAWNRQPTRN